MIRNRTLFAAALTLMLSLAAAPVYAQMCFGLPLNAGQSAVALEAGFPDNATSFGVEGRHKLTDAVVLGAGYTLTSFDDDLGDDVPNQHTVGVQGAYEIRTASTTGGPQLGICPNVGFNYGSMDDLSMYSIPLGVGLGTAFEVGSGTAVVAPYVNPALVFGKADLGEIETDWENDFGFTAGANLIVTNLFFGLNFNKVGDGDGVFGLQAGLVF